MEVAQAPRPQLAHRAHTPSTYHIDRVIICGQLPHREGSRHGERPRRRVPAARQDTNHLSRGREDWSECRMGAGSGGDTLESAQSMQSTLVAARPPGCR